MSKKVLMNDLINTNQDRIVRKTINLAGKEIIVYEPVEIEYSEIMEYIKINKLQVISSVETIKYLLPLLTNLDLNDTSNEELNKILDKKPLWLQLTIAEIQSIINQMCNLELLNTINQIQDAENLFATYEIIQKAPVDKLEKILNLNADNILKKLDKIVGLKEQTERVTEIKNKNTK